VVGAELAAYAGLSLPEVLRQDYSLPWGVVVSGDVSGLLSGRVACVGDYVSLYCLRASERLEALVLVVDGVTRRLERAPGIPSEGFEVYRVVNKRGTLSLEAHRLVCSLLSRGSGRYLVIVDGEEDMVALSAIACGHGWTVVYGMPGVGAVLVRVTPATASTANTRMLSLRPLVDWLRSPR